MPVLPPKEKLGKGMRELGMPVSGVKTEGEAVDVLVCQARLWRGESRFELILGEVAG